MDGQEEILVRGSADDVRRPEKCPRQYGRVPEQICGADLQTHDGEHDVLRQRLRPAELEDLELRSLR